jgi:hypothetical protein
MSLFLSSFGPDVTSHDMQNESSYFLLTSSRTTSSTVFSSVNGGMGVAIRSQPVMSPSPGATPSAAGVSDIDETGEAKGSLSYNDL